MVVYFQQFDGSSAVFLFTKCMKIHSFDRFVFKFLFGSLDCFYNKNSQVILFHGVGTSIAFNELTWFKPFE